MKLEEKVTPIMLEEKIPLTQMLIIIQVDLPMKILQQTEVQIVWKEAVHHNLLQIQHQEALQEEIIK